MKKIIDLKDTYRRALINIEDLMAEYISLSKGGKNFEKICNFALKNMQNYKKCIRGFKTEYEYDTYDTIALLNDEETELPIYFEFKNFKVDLKKRECKHLVKELIATDLEIISSSDNKYPSILHLKDISDECTLILLFDGSNQLSSDNNEMDIYEITERELMCGIATADMFISYKIMCNLLIFNQFALGNIKEDDVYKMLFMKINLFL